MGEIKGSLWICGYRWRVEIVDREIFDDGKPVHGVTLHKTLTIRASRFGLSREQLISTLLHEAEGHAYFETLGGYPEDEERGAEKIEAAAYSMHTDRRNRWFWEIIFDGDVPTKKVRRCHVARRHTTNVTVEGAMPIPPTDVTVREVP